MDVAAVVGHDACGRIALARAVVTRLPDVLFVPAHVIPYVQPRRRLPPSVVTLHDSRLSFFPAAAHVAAAFYLSGAPVGAPMWPRGDRREPGDGR
ncbi:MAG: hypothetical protein R2854_02330 [Caldilineaceae bacterium]